MRAKSLILFVIAVGCGLAASIGVSQYMETAGTGPGIETAKIFVAMTEIGIGDKFDAQNVKLEEWPRDRIPEGAIVDLAELEGKFSKSRMYAGEPILAVKLTDTNTGSASKTIPKGYRAVSVKVDATAANGGNIQPGDRVDVLVMLRKSTEIPETATRTILRDVNVFGVDGQTERSVDEEGRTYNVSNVSLLLKPKQAETVLLATELGRLLLTLRSPDDDAEELAEGGVSVREMLGTDGESANEKKEDGETGGLGSWLTQLSQPAASTHATAVPTVQVPPAVEVPQPVWKMEILGQTGSKNYHWMDAEQLPIEGDTGAATPTSASIPPAVVPTIPITAPQPPVKLGPGELRPSSLTNDGDDSGQDAT